MTRPEEQEEEYGQGSSWGLQVIEGLVESYSVFDGKPVKVIEDCHAVISVAVSVEQLGYWRLLQLSDVMKA